ITLRRSACEAFFAGSLAHGESAPLARRRTFRSPMRPPSGTSPRSSTAGWLGAAHEVAAPPPSEGCVPPARSLEGSLEARKRFHIQIQTTSHGISVSALGGEVDR